MARPQVYVFFRPGHFYPLELVNDEDARANAECNPGTIRVEDGHGRVIWPVVEPTQDTEPVA